ncbi:MAG: hypothetical protein KGL13_00785 [Gammaproteobacteria bacterium]|nr:hypothetical protein [Gammaproteobacteria bacterium]MDE2344979.1 hypothetical protein [Gammaproteobacteria bacterium]
MLRKIIYFAVAVLIVLMVVHKFSMRPVARSDGVLAPDAPLQTDFTTPQPPLHMKDASLEPLAKFALTARVLSRDDYHFDAGAYLSPTDLALGWGRMSDSAVLRHINIQQGVRFYTWNVKTFPIPRREIETHSANMHMIPANSEVARELKQVRVGDLVTLDGLLVEADRPGGWRWRSSLTRDDTGPGACELVYVEDLTINPRP